MSNLLGGNSKQSQSSSTSNQAYPYLQGALSGDVSNGTSANDMLSQLLGGDQSGLQNFQNSSGFQNQLQQGSQAVTDNAASRGLLQSGGTGKALTSYGQGLASQSYNSYLQNLLGLSNAGTAAAGVISGAGQTSTGTQSSKSKTGLGL